MSEPELERDRTNDPYAAIDRISELLLERSQEAVRNGEEGLISDRAVVNIMTAAVKLYAAKAARVADPFRPLTGSYDQEVTATEVLTTTIELLRALGLGPMELGLWTHRKPKDYVYPQVQDDLPANRSISPAKDD